MNFKEGLSWLLRITIAIFLQTLYFKFTAHPDSVYIFSKLGVEPYGRIGLGIIELITSLLIWTAQNQNYWYIVVIGHHYRSFVSTPVGYRYRGKKGDSGTLFFFWRWLC